MDNQLLNELLNYSPPGHKQRKADRILRLCVKAGKIELAKRIIKKYPGEQSDMAIALAYSTMAERTMMIGPSIETGDILVHAAMKEGKAVLVVDGDHCQSYRSDLIPEIKNIAAKPIIIPRIYRARGKGTNLTPPKKKRKKRT